MEVKDINRLIEQRLVHEVHTSERRSFRGCRRRWSWVFQDFYYPQVTAKPLEFGVAFHNAMETLYDPSTWSMTKHPAGREVVLQAAITNFVETCKSQKKKFWDSDASSFADPDEVDADYEERLELGKGMLTYYWNDLAPDWDKHLTPIKVEVEFIVPIQNPDDKSFLFCKCKRCQVTIQQWREQHIEVVEHSDGHIEPAEDLQEILRINGLIEQYGLPVCLAGRLDMLVKDEHGDLWIVDWKTAARLARGDASGQDRDEFLELDDQIGSYVMALRRKLGLNVRGFIYVELKKAFPEAPTRNKVMRLGRMYSVNQNQNVDFDTYLKTVKEHDTEAYEAGLYDDFLNFLKNGGVNFHGRYQIMKSDDELEEIERQLWMEAADMTDPDLRIYASPGRFSCGFCAFRQPCLETYRQGDPTYLLDTLFDKRDKHYWARDLSTDKQGGE